MTAPVIYDKSIMAVDDYHADNPSPWFTGSCDVLWGTDSSSTSLVEYGHTIGYGSTTTLDANLVKNHVVTLTGLDENSTYHYRVRSKSALDEETFSADHVFKVEQATGIPTYDFKIRAFGPKNGYQGSKIIWNIELYKLAGDMSNMYTSFEVVSGLPTGATVVFIADYLHSAIRWVDSYGRAYGAGPPKEPPATIDDLPLAIVLGPASPVGDYTITLRVTVWDKDTLIDQHQETTTIDISVEASPTAYVAPALGSQPALPDVALWESNMDLGRDPKKGPSYPDLLNGFFSTEGLAYYLRPGQESGAWYYDGMRVAYNVREHLGVLHPHYDYWNSAVANVYNFYYPWVCDSQLANGWRHFTGGARLAYQKDGAPAAYKNLVHRLYTESSWAIGLPGITSACVGTMVQTVFGREVSYAVNAAIDEHLLGNAIDADRLHAYVDCLLGMIDQWFSSRTSPYFQPFMMGLIAEALINYHDLYDQYDYRILPKLKIAADYLWDNVWRADLEGFFYESKNWSDFQWPSILNLLIVEIYGWIYRETGNTTYRDRGDAIWTGGVNHGEPGWNGKQYCQSYKASFKYYAIRTAGQVRNTAGDEIRKLCSPENSAFSSGLQARQVSGGDVLALCAWVIERKPAAKPSAHRTITAVDGSDVSASGGCLDVGNSPAVAVHADVSAAGSLLSLCLVLYDEAEDVVGVTETVEFTASASRDGSSGPYLCPSRILDVAGASRVKAWCSSITAGATANVYLVPL